MKKLYTLFLSVTSLFAFSQAPKLINYQGIARSANGNPIINTSVALRFEILQGATTFYSEDQTGVSVNSLGLFSTQIGKTGNLPAVWGNGTYSLKVSMDTLNGTNFVALGNPQQLVSVPFALNAPSPTISVTNNTLLTVGTETATLPSPAGLQSLGISGNSLNISNSNTVTIPPVGLTGAGATTVAANGGYGYTVGTPSVTLVGGTSISIPIPPFSVAVPPGLAQVMGSYPNYSIIVTPTISYSQLTGSLTLSNIPGTTPTYTYEYGITPLLTFNNGILQSGPPSNSQNMNSYLPWRYQIAPNTVTLASVSSSVGIGTYNPNTQLHVDGFTRLGVTAPAMQVMTFTAQTASAANTATTITLPSYTLQGGTAVPITTNKIVSASVLVSLATGEWVHENSTAVTNSLFDWHLGSNGTSIVVTNLLTSGSILSRPIKITITYTP